MIFLPMTFSRAKQLLPRTIAPWFATSVSGRIFLGCINLDVLCIGLEYSSSRTRYRSYSISKKPNGDRFQLLIPYAGKTLSWEVILDNNYPDDPPDFIFGAEENDFCPELEDIKSLSNWNASDPQALLNVLVELVAHYRTYQQRQIEAHSRVQFEYTSLIEASLKPDDIEVYVHKTESKIGPIVFLIKMTADFSKIPPYLTKDNPGEDSAVLLVNFPSPNTSRVTPQLFLSPRVENALGGAASLRIPAFPSGSCLLDYVPTVHELLQNKIDQVSQGFGRKKEYIAAFLSNFGRSVLEYDAEAFSKISFLFEWNDFFFILHIELPDTFPQEQPMFTFQSIYHECKGKPYTEVLNDYPYSPRWSSEEMADRAKSYILENIKAFQKASVLSGSL